MEMETLTRISRSVLDRFNGEAIGHARLAAMYPRYEKSGREAGFVS